MHSKEGLAPVRQCRCRVLTGHPWWQEILENADYQVERFDEVNRLVSVLTIRVAADPDNGEDLFLTVTDVDWAALLGEFADPVATRQGQGHALAAHDQLLARVTHTLALKRSPTRPQPHSPTAPATAAGTSSS